MKTSLLRILLLPLLLAACASVSFGQDKKAPEPIGLTEKEGVKVAYHIKVPQTEKDGTSSGVNELLHLTKIYDQQGIGTDKRDIHGVFDAAGVDFLLTDEAYARLGKGASNPNAALITQLFRQGVSVEACGQRMLRDGLKPEDLLPGVKVVLGGPPRLIDLQLQGFAYFRF